MLAFKYSMEAMTLAKSTVKELEKIHCLVGNFILPTPNSTSQISSWMDTGLLPIKYRIWIKKAQFYREIITKKNDEYLQECNMGLIEMGQDDS